MANEANLTEVLDVAKREITDVPAEFWDRLESVIRGKFATARVYINARPTESHLAALLAADASADSERLSQMLGVSVRRVQQLRKLQRK